MQTRQDVQPRSTVYGWYVVVLLALSNGVSFFDRGLVSLVIDPIKHTLHITDTEIGIMLGPAFILFYSTISLPIGRLADTLVRKRIILSGMFFWSICTGLFGLAKNFLVLGGARMGVGLGEAALVPAGVSIIGDMFPREKMGRAVAMFTAGGILGGSLASLLGGLLLGWLNKVGTVRVPVFGLLEPWQSAFTIISVPGVILGLVIWATMREPARLHRASGVGGGATLRETAAYLWLRKRSAWALILGMACLSAQSGTSTWMATHYMRTFHLGPSQIGPPMGLISIFVGVPSSVLGGYVADRLRQRGREDSNILVAIWALAVMLPLGVIVPNLPNPYWAIAIQAPSLVAVCMAYGVAHPCVSLAVPPNMRSQAVAIYLLCANTLGIGVIPLVIPLITDYVFHDPLALKYAITIVTVIFLPLGIVLLMIARKPFIALMKTPDWGAAELDAPLDSVPVVVTPLGGGEEPPVVTGPQEWLPNAR